MAVTATVVVRMNRLPGAEGRIRRRIDDVNNKALLDVVAVADPLTPVDTGDLKGRKVIALSSGGRGGSIHWTMFYAAYQELGTARGVTPKLFATTAVSRVRPGWLAAFRAIGGSV